jgi:SAM-dependent methyltransferase
VKPKPKHLRKPYSDQFRDQAVADVYHHRPEYPPQTFDLLTDLVDDPPGAVLDAGCGTGFLARPLAARTDAVSHVDAVDVSAAMIEQGKRLPGGDNPRLRWILAPIEDAPLHGPYALITAGDSLHWMEWEQAFDRFRDALTPAGVLAVTSCDVVRAPWWDDLFPVLSRYSTNRDFRPIVLVDELQARRLFDMQGEARTEPVTFTQPVEDYVESFHARNGFSRQRMTPDNADAFDRAARDVVAAHCPDGVVRLQIRGHIVWGRPSPN